MASAVVSVVVSVVLARVHTHSSRPVRGWYARPRLAGAAATLKRARRQKMKRQRRETRRATNGDASETRHQAGVLYLEPADARPLPSR